jgi:hypothetical protein
MTAKRLSFLLLGAAILVGGTTVQAQAFCGVIEESAVAKTAKRATREADYNVLKQIRKLKRKHGRKLVVERASVACVGGGVAIDSNGNQIVGKPRCTVTRGFCVNP